VCLRSGVSGPKVSQQQKGLCRQSRHWEWAGHNVKKRRKERAGHGVWKEGKKNPGWEGEWEKPKKIAHKTTMFFACKEINTVSGEYRGTSKKENHVVWFKKEIRRSRKGVRVVPHHEKVDGVLFVGGECFEGKSVGTRGGKNTFGNQ